MGIPRNNLLIMGGIVGVVLMALLGGAFWFLKKRKKKKAAVELPGSLPEGAKDKTAADKQLAAGEKADGVVDKVDSTPQMSEEEMAEIAALKAAQEERQVLGSIKLPETTTKKASVLTKHIAEEAKKNPGAMAQIVRTWINNEEAS